MIISVYLANFFDSWKTITIKNHFLCFLHFLKKLFRLQKIIRYNYNWCIKQYSLSKMKLILEIIKKNFCFGLQDDFTPIVIVWKILEESHYGQLFYGSNYSHTHGSDRTELKSSVQFKSSLFGEL